MSSGAGASGVRATGGGRVPASRQWIANWLRLTPVICTQPDGSVTTGGVLPGSSFTVRDNVFYVEGVGVHPHPGVHGGADASLGPPPRQCPAGAPRR